MNIPPNHPRKKSLEERKKIEIGFEKGIVAKAGLIAHGRGEALDYLLGEKTTKEAKEQIEAAAAELLLANSPVISVNGNTTALCAKEIIKLSKQIPAKIEVNLFYRTKKRIHLIEKEFSKYRAGILGTKRIKKIAGLKSKRASADQKGIWSADVILVMLEDGDRTEYLRKAGKFVISIDLNPLSRSAKKANITIVDNIVRAIPLLTKKIKEMKREKKETLMKKLEKFNNSKTLKKIEKGIRRGLK